MAVPMRLTKLSTTEPDGHHQDDADKASFCIELQSPLITKLKIFTKVVY